MEFKSTIKSIYLYLVSFAGLLMFVISTGVLFNLALKAWIFTKADQPYPQRPPTMYSEKGDQALLNLAANGGNLTVSQQEALERWEKDYRQWEADQKAYDADQLIRNRQSQAAAALPYFIIGGILYWTHWQLVKREKENE